MKTAHIVRGAFISVAILSIALFGIFRHDNLVISSNFHCFNNGCMINACKSQWAFAQHATNGAAVSPQDIAPYSLEHGRFVCMSGGTISIGKLGEDPTCTVHGNIGDMSRFRKEDTWLINKAWPR